jgi:hypothetical protein
MYKTLASAVAVAVVAAAVMIGLAGAASAAPPDPVSGTIVLPPDFTFCNFDITAVLAGKSKTIEKDGFTIATSPGLKITLSANDKSYTFVATGSFKVTPLDNGNVLHEYRGRNLVSDPTVGFLALSGHFTWLTNADGTVTVQPLQGTGNRTDICALLA